MLITAYRIATKDRAMTIRPGARQRSWMDETPNKYAYRCLPLSIANCTGWDFFPPCNFIINWSGGSHKNDLHINYEEEGHHFAASSFGSGIVTFHSGYLFKTDPGWDLLATGPINDPPPWGDALSGIIETWWLDFTFTFNYKLRAPGWFEVSKDKPLARVIPIPHEIEIETRTIDIYNDEEQLAKFDDWRVDRALLLHDLHKSFYDGKNTGLVELENPSTHWEKTYYNGLTKDGEKQDEHIIKRKYPSFKEP